MTTEPYVPNEYTAKQMYVLQRQSMHNHISPDYGAEFDRFIAKIKADAIREAASGFVDWDALRGDAQVTPEIEESHKSANYLMREADRIEGEV